MNIERHRACGTIGVMTADTVAEVTALLRRGERAVQAGEMNGILAPHIENAVMFEAPEPPQSLGPTACRRTWESFGRYGAREATHSSSRTCE